MSDTKRELGKTFVKVTSLHQQNYSDRNTQAEGFNAFGSHQKLIHNFGGINLKEKHTHTHTIKIDTYERIMLVKRI